MCNNATASLLIPIADDLTRLVAEISVENLRYEQPVAIPSAGVPLNKSKSDKMR